MSIPQPTLDDLTYADLLDEARLLIPSLAPQWTNHNPSDPGITLIELFAWLTEMLIYRVNRLPKANTRAFLRLLNGPQWVPGLDLDEDIRTTVLNLRQRYRAVTAEDYEALAREASPPSVARARCVPRRNLAEQTEANRLVPRDGYVSVIVAPKLGQAPGPGSQASPPLPGDDLLSAVREFLQPRRLVTVRQVVVPPVYVPIQAELVVAARPGVSATALSARMARALTGLLDPLTGGAESQGWPFGRDVYVSELYLLLEREVPGVDYVPDITLSSSCPEGALRCVAGKELWNEDGDPIGIELAAHHLPWPRIDSARIAIGSAFLPVHVSFTATAKDGVAPAAAQRAAKTAVKLLFHPLHGGPGSSNPWQIANNEVAGRLTQLPEIKTVTNLELRANSARLFAEGTTTGVRFEAGEMANVTVTVHV